MGGESVAAATLVDSATVKVAPDVASFRRATRRLSARAEIRVNKR